MIVITESGTSYEFEGGRVRRHGDIDMRRDDEWLRFAHLPLIEVGRSMILVLEPLGEGDVTVRRTSRVVEVRQ